MYLLDLISTLFQNREILWLESLVFSYLLLVAISGISSHRADTSFACKFNIQWDELHLDGIELE
jgi:hypothetical protein